MKKRLLAVSVAATLVGIGGISSATLMSARGGPGKPATPGGIWSDGGSGRRKGFRGTGNRKSPAKRIAERARANRTSNHG